MGGTIPTAAVMMPAMLQRLRQIWFARLVLAGYVVLLAGGLLSSWLAPGDFQILCLGSGGMKMVVLDADGEIAQDDGSPAACPLAQVVPTPGFRAVTSDAPSPLEYATRPATVARLIALAGAPLPPRGPPPA